MLFSEYKKLNKCPLSNINTDSRQNDRLILVKITNMIKSEDYKYHYSRFLSLVYSLSFIGLNNSILYSIDTLFQNKTSTVSKNMFIQDLINLIYIDNETPNLSKYSYLRYEKVKETPKEFTLLFNPDMKPKHCTDEVLTLLSKVTMEEFLYILKILDSIIPVDINN